MLLSRSFTKKFAASVSTVRASNSFFYPKALDLEKRKVVMASFAGLPKEKSMVGPDKHCLLSVSVGQHQHQGCFLAATMAAIDRRFEHCTIVLGDFLQRHTLPISSSQRSSDEFYREQAIMQGREWVVGAADLIANMNIPVSIIHWEHYLENNQYLSLAAHIKNLYATNAEYQSTIDVAASVYVSRLQSRNEMCMPMDEAKEQCVKYLLEECAAMCLWVNEGCGYELYPGGRTPAMQKTYEMLIEPLHPDLLKPAAIKFKSKALSQEQIDSILGKQGEAVEYKFRGCS